MKKHLLLFFAALLCGLSSTAQNKLNLVVFSEDAEPFYAYINGVRQNDKPESNVKITGIAPNISLRIVFENRALPELKQNMSLESGFEHTARIKRDSKQQMKLKYFGMTPLEESVSSVPTVPYHTTETAAVAQTQGQGANGEQTTITSSTTSTTRTSNGTTTENVAVNINMAGVGINMNVTGMDPNATTMSSTSSTTVTSSSSGSYGSGNETVAKPVPAASNAGCSSPMSQSSFSTMKKSVESKPFSDTKMSTAKVATKNGCLSIDQVKEICKLFSMDDDKLAYAKYAYDYCVEKTNYYTVSEVFSFSSTTDEFNKFLEK